MTDDRIERMKNALKKLDKDREALVEGGKMMIYIDDIMQNSIKTMYRCVEVTEEDLRIAEEVKPNGVKPTTGDSKGGGNTPDSNITKQPIQQKRRNRGPQGAASK